MKTSAEWWQEVKADPEKFIAWLKNQYHGETTAAERLDRFLETYGGEASSRNIMTIRRIAVDERQHAVWIGECLLNRGQDPQRLDKKERYWDETIGSIDSFAKGCAVAAHAEAMRLERIRVIANDKTAPWDVVSTFKLILSDETFHERAFREMGLSEMDSVAPAHAAGLEALGLVV